MNDVRAMNESESSESFYCFSPFPGVSPRMKHLRSDHPGIVQAPRGFSLSRR